VYSGADTKGTAGERGLGEKGVQGAEGPEAEMPKTSREVGKTIASCDSYRL